MLNFGIYNVFGCTDMELTWLSEHIEQYIHSTDCHIML